MATLSPCAPEPQSPVCVPCLLARLAQAPVGGFEVVARQVPAGAPLFIEGEELRFLYAVRSGSFKLSMTTARGGGQVTGFRFAGDLLGLDGFADERHHVSAVAVEPSEVASVPRDGLREALAARPDLAPALWSLLGQELVRENRRVLLLGTLHARERVAAFLLNASRRATLAGGNPTAFALPMSRTDIGSFLGLSLETVSRILHRFQRSGLVALGRRDVRIVEPERLRAFFGPLPGNDAAAA